LIRDIYEAVLIYAFFNLLSSYLAYDSDLKQIDYERIYDMLSNKGVKKHMFPMNFVWKDLLLISKIRGQWFFEGCRLYILQYLAIKPLVTFILLIMYLTGSAGGFFSGLLQAIVFVSVSYSVYYLVLFYQILKDELAYAKPLLKFLSVKGVLFFTFWQDMVIHGFRGQLLLLFDNPDEKDFELLIAGAGCILICFEMVLLSVLTTIAFSYKDFTDSQKKNWLLDQSHGVIGLGKKLISDVVTENIITTFEDLKDLKNPIKDPFRTFTSGEVKRKMSDQVAVDVNAEKDCHAEVHENPYVVPEFFAPKQN